MAVAQEAQHEIVETHDGIGVGEAFERDAEGLLRDGRLRRSILRTRCARREEKDKDEANGALKVSPRAPLS